MTDILVDGGAWRRWSDIGGMAVHEAAAKPAEYVDERDDGAAEAGQRQSARLPMDAELAGAFGSFKTAQQHVLRAHMDKFDALKRMRETGPEIGGGAIREALEDALARRDIDKNRFVSVVEWVKDEMSVRGLRGGAEVDGLSRSERGRSITWSDFKSAANELCELFGRPEFVSDEYLLWYIEFIYQIASANDDNFAKLTEDWEEWGDVEKGAFMALYLTFGYVEMGRPDGHLEVLLDVLNDAISSGKVFDSVEEFAVRYVLKAASKYEEISNRDPKEYLETVKLLWDETSSNVHSVWLLALENILKMFDLLRSDGGGGGGGHDHEWFPELQPPPPTILPELRPPPTTKLPDLPVKPIGSVWDDLVKDVDDELAVLAAYEQWFSALSDFYDDFTTKIYANIREFIDSSNTGQFWWNPGKFARAVEDLFKSYFDRVAISAGSREQLERVLDDLGLEASKMDKDKDGNWYVTIGNISNGPVLKMYDQMKELITLVGWSWEEVLGKNGDWEITAADFNQKASVLESIMSRFEEAMQQAAQKYSNVHSKFDNMQKAFASIIQLMTDMMQGLLRNW
ncbi:hypothetical protein WL21_04740 [Burkholderia ubonensis]|uniref:hypothetical protein n=1 Tax=Burkholderia ubonensis TaxID=101571 RepID=UPI000757440D|nr:hypothetical protein [Burkholderia ubonensis]KVO87693.1 hypothetical protein WJ81_15710 [Burkholderia ubonensis]KVZ57310.1 hypothetical protein WL20_23495 [Burkholderia ubonensis]KVZ73007.1 hypothetical protein WL21_04740 [Burkholderia ubonensis]